MIPFRKLPWLPRSLEAMATRASTSCSGYAPTDVEEMGTMTQPGLDNGEFL
jgi:hypothetical protein